MQTMPRAGTLTDEEMTELCSRSLLISENFEPRNVKQCCYELRASSEAYEIMSPREDKKIEVTSAGYVMRPHSFLTILTMEVLNLPPDILGRILTKGQLFSIGLLPVNTYADPGFKGRLGITLYNASLRYLIIKPSQAIAKIEFSALVTSVANPYSGQHGYETRIWPIPTDLYAKPADLKARGILPGSANELDLIYGTSVGLLKRKVDYYEKTVWCQIAATMLLVTLILWLYGHVSWVSSIVLGVAGNLVTQLAPWALSKALASTT